jgi:hypothetical protein
MLGAFAGSLMLPAAAGATSTGLAMLVAGLVIAAGAVPLATIARRPARDEGAPVTAHAMSDS